MPSPAVPIIVVEGSNEAFWLILGVMLVVAIALVTFFRLKRFL